MKIPQHEKELIDQYSEQFQIFRNEIMSDESYRAIYESTPYQNWKLKTVYEPVIDPMEALKAGALELKKEKIQREIELKKQNIKALESTKIKPFHPVISFLIWTGITIAVGSILTILVCSAIFYIKALFV